VTATFNVNRAMNLKASQLAYFRKSKVGDRDFIALIERFKTANAKLVRNLNKGLLSADSFADEMADLLETAHAQAAYLGRVLAGDNAPIEDDDKKLGELMVDVEAEYLDAFSDDLKAKDPRYFNESGKLRTDRVLQRANWYLGKLRGTANESFVLASAVDELFAWEMLTEEHCDDCPRYAAGGPYKGDKLPTYPGMCETKCKFHCGCILVRLSDGAFGFSRLYDLSI
jgi:hypothetical protein